MTHQVDLSQAISFYQMLIKQQANDEELNWIDQQEQKLRDQFHLRSFYLAFSSAPRFISKGKLHLTQEELTHADTLRKGFQPGKWNLLQTVRTYFLLMLPKENAEDYAATLTKLFETADMEEQVALYAALPLLLFPDILAKRAAEGIRTDQSQRLWGN